MVEISEEATTTARIEFHRNAVALMPHQTDSDGGVAVMVLSEKAALSYRGCSCTGFKSRTCQHLKTLGAVLKGREEVRLYPFFKQSVWYRLAEMLWEADDTPIKSVRSKAVDTKSSVPLEIVHEKGHDLLRYLSGDPPRSRLVERLLDGAGQPYGSRCDVLERLALFTLTDTERKLMKMGMKTRRQAFEESFWYRMAYHAFREYGAGGFSFRHIVDERSGRFRMTVAASPDDPLFDIVIPRKAVKRILDDPGIPVNEREVVIVSSEPVKPILNIRKDRRGGLRLTPTYIYKRKDGRPGRLTQKQFSKFKFGTLIYLPETGTMAPIAPADELFRKYGKPSVIGKSNIPAFLETFGETIRSGGHRVSESTGGLSLFRAPERITIAPNAIDRDWCWLSLKYGFGNTELSLNDILDARKSGRKFISISDGWVDVDALPTDMAPRAEDVENPGDGNSDRVTVRPFELFRLQAAVEKPLEIVGDASSAADVRRLLSLESAVDPPSTEGLASPLRDYQKVGVNWLWFLHQNGFGGLLCDDMGLGKTHQVMAMMLCLQKSAPSPFLVVCPTTVMSHWEKKLRQYAPSLKAEIYHGKDRNLQETIEGRHVLITSYGIALRDIEKLADTSFSLVVFDEIQYIKNPDTKGYRAAQRIRADMKIGLTGTPIENSLRELKALMDTVVPGYLGGEADFKKRYVTPIENAEDHVQKRRLARLVSPFTLRRLKATVLDELPEKIEDIRFCLLSEDQVRLYRDAVESRQAGVMEKLRDHDAQIPYIHIFALLTLLKQICNHPALVEKSEDYGQWESGKWEVFTELLEQSIESGQKVVVYSQFVEMIRIMEKHLSDNRIGHAVLTGQSRNRGEIISRFNEDPDCRVFIGSLKAGGTGIDLVAASVVIHYDRWWNAAKEDQATDRVHRIGQRRGVQVFKLVTEGTLEEKISAVIERKRDLMDGIVREDDPGLLKTFTREELLEMLALPG